MEDYYLGGTEPPGRWRGELAREVGLGGEVNAATLHALLDEPPSEEQERVRRARSPALT